MVVVVVVEVDPGETVGWTKSLKTMFTVANELLNIIHEINNNNNNNNKIKQAKTAKVEKTPGIRPFNCFFSNLENEKSLSFENAL